MKKYRTVSMEENVIKQVKAKFPGLSMNKAYKAMLIQSGNFTPDDEDNQLQDAYDQMKYYVNSRLKALSEKFEERVLRIESVLQ